LLKRETALVKIGRKERKNLAKLESTASRRMGASQGKHDHQLVVFSSRLDRRKTLNVKKHWLSWNLQPRTAVVQARAN
jgi:hypothetical protein